MEKPHKEGKTKNKKKKQNKIQNEEDYQNLCFDLVDLDRIPKNSVFDILSRVFEKLNDLKTTYENKIAIYSNRSTRLPEILNSATDTFSKFQNLIGENIHNDKLKHVDGRGGWDTFEWIIETCLRKVSKVTQNYLPDGNIEGIVDRIRNKSQVDNFISDSESHFRDLGGIIKIFPYVIQATLSPHIFTDEYKEDLLANFDVAPFWYRYDFGLTTLKSAIDISKLSVAAAVSEDTKFMQGVIGSVHAVKQVLNSEQERCLASRMLTRGGDVKILAELWNLPSRPFISNMMHIVLPSIGVSKRIAVPRPATSPVFCQFIYNKKKLPFIKPGKLDKNPSNSLLNGVQETPKLNKSASNILLNVIGSKFHPHTPPSSPKVDRLPEDETPEKEPHKHYRVRKLPSELLHTEHNIQKVQRKERDKKYPRKLVHQDHSSLEEYRRTNHSLSESKSKGTVSRIPQDKKRISLEERTFDEVADTPDVPKKSAKSSQNIDITPTKRNKYTRSKSDPNLTNNVSKSSPASPKRSAKKAEKSIIKEDLQSEQNTEKTTQPEKLTPSSKRRIQISKHSNPEDSSALNERRKRKNHSMDLAASEQSKKEGTDTSKGRNLTMDIDGVELNKRRSPLIELEGSDKAKRREPSVELDGSDPSKKRYELGGSDQLKRKNEPEGSLQSSKNADPEKMRKSKEKDPMRQTQRPKKNRATEGTPEKVTNDRVELLHSPSSLKIKPTIILHFHGGGFISGDPVAHEVYLRDWARDTGALIISVDYTLAPEGKFPTAVDECFHVYRWLVEKNPWGIEVPHIILCGDSAGGNLVLTTAYKAIEENIRVPDALLLAYPAVDLTKDTITPSRVMYINDVLVPYHALLLCHDSYFAVETHSKTKYHLCSPLYAPDQLLLKLPSLITIMTAGLDPLADDGLKLVRRLENLGKKVEHFHYRGVPHGFLNFGQVISMASDAKNKACEVLQEMIRKLEEN